MDLFTQVLIGFCLATDAFAVSITNGICSRRVTKENVLATALTFGAFQGIMPVLGFALGNSFAYVIYRYQHFVVLFLLGSIGVNMIVEAIKEIKHPEELHHSDKIFTPKNLILQGIATSIDALAVGVSLSAIDADIAETSLLIGIITFLCCGFGVYIGRKFGVLLGLKAKLVGGILLILIGTKSFL